MTYNSRQQSFERKLASCVSTFLCRYIFVHKRKLRAYNHYLFLRWVDLCSHSNYNAIHVLHAAASVTMETVLRSSGFTKEWKAIKTKNDLKIEEKRETERKKIKLASSECAFSNCKLWCLFPGLAGFAGICCSIILSSKSAREEAHKIFQNVKIKMTWY